MRRLVILCCFLVFACRAPKTATVLKPLLSIDPATVGSIRGIVRFDGTPPAPAKIPLGRFRDCANPREEDEDVLIRDGRVQNAFVYIKEGLEGYAFPPPESEVALDQRGCLYSPRVLGMRVGQNLVIRNSDLLFHNVHALPKLSHSFNVAMNQGAPEIRKSFDEPEVMVAIRCDVHPWMRAYVGVLPHPCFAVTGPDGAFEIKNVPPGNYALEAWHERLGRKTKEVLVVPKGSPKAEFVFP